MKKLLSLALCMVLLCALLPECASAFELTYVNARISSSPAVYSGPSRAYYRANNGKAQYGKGGGARIYGVTENGWMMIGYKTGSGVYRIGYAQIIEDDLYDWEYCNLPILVFDYDDAYINQNCALTMDPVTTAPAEIYLKKGCYVSYLADLGSWAYVEVSTSLGVMRGFVKSGNVTLGGGGKSGGMDYTVKPTGATATPMPQAEVRTLETGYLSYVQGKIEQAYNVYMGPSADYPRAANGTAYVGANSTIRVYGKDGDSLMIGYKTSSGDFRIGYITDYTLPANISDEAAGDIASVYTPVAMHTTSKVNVTDDPVTNMKAVESLPKGTEVTFLAWVSAKKNYALVEYYSPTYQCNVRGFVLGSKLAED